MAERTLHERAGANASGIAAVVVTGTWLAMLMLDFANELWLAVMLFGYIAVVPVVSMLFDEADESETASSYAPATGAEAETTDEEALETLRRRYAEGKLTDDQFERKLERLLETETLEDVRSHARSKRETADRERSLDRE